MNLDKIETISIRGRLAFGATCFERALKHYNARTEQMNKLLLAIWQFTASEKLDQWEQNMRKFLVDDYQLQEFSHKYDVSFLQEKEQQFLYELIDNVIEIGMGNLYAGYVSKYTLNPTIKVAELMEREGIALPTLENFKRSKASEAHGWGNCVDKSFFR
jgi:hypothetical protein